MSGNITLSQACNILQMMERANLSGDQTTALHRYLPILLEAVRERRLPTLTEFRRRLQPRSTDFPVIAKGFDGFCESRDAFLRLLGAAHHFGVHVESSPEHISNNLMRAMSEKGTYFSETQSWDVVKITPKMIGIDPFLFEGNDAMCHDFAIAYICRIACEHGLELFSEEAVLRFTLHGHLKGRHRLLVATPLCIGSTMNWRNFISIQEGRVEFNRYVLHGDTEILFLRKSEEAREAQSAVQQSKKSNIINFPSRQKLKEGQGN